MTPPSAVNDEYKTRMKSDELACPEYSSQKRPLDSSKNIIKRTDVGQGTKPYRRVWHLRRRHLSAGPQERGFQLATRPRRLGRSAESFAWRNSDASKENPGPFAAHCGSPPPQPRARAAAQQQVWDGKLVPNGGLSALRVTLVQILVAEPIARPLMT
ncbi:hypothetical protein CSOJ01_10500 [Colletotrichum sojae]|uniref:Uncharacterized protein n=1 Tax=Colletotrichum sojae TaxID=2175907 RepID=A0A8H6MPB1_9PEZI|nr:hypothetical protein CSOJ01_10500 [Colletotrichum sojae]